MAARGLADDVKAACQRKIGKCPLRLAGKFGPPAAPGCLPSNWWGTGSGGKLFALVMEKGRGPSGLAKQVRLAVERASRSSWPTPIDSCRLQKLG